MPPGISELTNLAIVETDTEPLYHLKLEQNLSINQLDEPYIQLLYAIMTDDDGNIYWQDNQVTKLHQYSPEGEHIRSFGGEGRGPGEFEYLESSSISGDAVIMLDLFSQLVHVFNRHTGDLMQSGTLERENEMAVFAPIHQVLAETDTTFIGIPQYSTRIEQDSISLHRYTISGRWMDDRLIRYPAGDALESSSGGVSRRSPTSFTAKSEIALLPGGGFVHSYAAEPIFYIYDMNGDLRQSIYLETEPVKLTGEHIDRLIEKSHPMIDLASAVRDADSVPDFWPFWNDFLTDDNGHLWIEININPPDEREWWVVSQDGDLLAKTQFSDKGTLWLVGKDDLYFNYYEEGIYELKRYRLRME
ncbi:hypothetical protein DYD21_12085 [Rhodohalobacter sp. SW132]|uniref:hypothetical protein n=1 Tax=Rhodohalobacter sp. SW132 TaxID=2293433 RepID=UPI000E382115|nr:hypothetical protein [Rhodohalobacter sp. SW132]REL33501.1 hypothetical protein DYD21_12085 [Rhodohalobacter sp. SW132]